MGSIYYIDSDVLSVIEKALPDVLEKTGCLCVLLVENSGVVLLSAGDTPLHPNEAGVTAAGLYAAMNVMIKATRATSFTILVPANEAAWLFQNVNDNLFLLAYHPKYVPQATADAHAVLSKLATAAVGSLSRDPNAQDTSVENLHYISDRLDELLKL